MPPPAIRQPPPLPSAKKRARWKWTAIVLVFAGLVGFLGLRTVQLVQYVRAHPPPAQPGEAEFRAANKEIIAGNDGEVFGNSDEARALAKEYSRSLKILRDNLFTKGGQTALGSLEGDFLTYCQLNDDSSVFLIHVPELRKFTAEAKQSLADLAWMNAQSVLQANTRRPPKTVVVGVKGLMFYDVILIGDYVADPEPDKDGIRTRGSGFADMKLFYPYFVPPPTQTNLPPMPISQTSSPPKTSAENSDITILAAWFGAGKKAADVTARVTELLRTRPDGFVVNARTLDRDPAPRKRKRLVIRYDYKGQNCVLTIQAGEELNRQALMKNAVK